MAVERNAMRDTLRFWSSGVTVVATTAATQELNYAGMTVSAFTSVSLEPPLILVCLAKNTTTANTVLQSQVFSVSLLSGEQAHLSERFAGRVALPEHGDRFDGIAVQTAVTGAPILGDALAWLDCRVQTVHDGGTHWIVLGEVVATGHQDDATPPLVYFNRGYYALADEPEHLTTGGTRLKS